MCKLLNCYFLSIQFLRSVFDNSCSPSLNSFFRRLLFLDQFFISVDLDFIVKLLLIQELIIPNFPLKLKQSGN